MVCPVQMAGLLDNRLRRLIQNPKKLLEPYILDGMTILDVGCGPGFFSIEMAKMLTHTGKVIAADLQEGMLDIVKRKILGTELEARIELHKCAEDKIGISEKVDFVIAFYMVHEVSNQESLFRELKSILKPNGKIYIIEPKFHVSKNSFEKMKDKTTELGFQIAETPKFVFSRAVVLTIN